MAGSILVAKVQRSRKRVELDGTVRPGTTIAAPPGSEVVILALSVMGHMVDAADAVARDLRRRGWLVKVRPYEFRAVETVGFGTASASAMVTAVIGTEPVAASVAKRARKPMTRWTSRRFRCDECGMETVIASLTTHQRRTGHIGRTFLETVVIDKTAKGIQEPGLDRGDAEAPPDGE